MNDSAATSSPRAIERRTLRKVAWRLLPLMFVAYVFNYLDRFNVGAAALTMKVDLGFDDTVYGFGAGVFFLGYVTFEVPSNLVLQRLGARPWIARIMVVWGLVSASMALVRSPAGFHLMRLLLGVAEAGFFPGMLFYLTRWFPAEARARAAARFMMATSVASVVGGPLAASLMRLDGAAGLRGWQWLFVLEGTPAVLTGAAVWWFLTERPKDAQWLKPPERQWLRMKMAGERAALRRRYDPTLREALANRDVLHLAGLFFTMQICGYAIGFFSPLLLQSRASWTPQTILLLSAIPGIFGVISMLTAAHYSDKWRERKAFLVAALLVEAGAMALCALARGPESTLLCLSVQTLAAGARNAPFWALCTDSLTGKAAAGSIALINSVGNLGGFVGPYVIGTLRTRTASYDSGLFVLAAFFVTAALIALALRPSSAQAATLATREAAP